MSNSAYEDRGDVKATPLHPEHVKLGARFGLFGNAEIVHDYGVETDEPTPLDHPLMTDLSFQGSIRVSGADSSRFMQAMMTADISVLEIGRSCYSLVLTSDAEIIDLVKVVRTGDDEYMVITDAPVTDEVMEWLENNSGVAINGERVFGEVVVENQSGQLGTICLMGPRNVDMLEELAGFISDATVDDPNKGKSDMAKSIRQGLYVGSDISDIPMMIVSDEPVEDSILVYSSRMATVAIWRGLLGFPDLQVVGFDQYVALRKRNSLWLDAVESGKYVKPADAGLTHLVRDGGGFVGANHL
ncbi:MAG: hypothetical protein ACOYIK_02650 [Coriobacteriales bacterium]|jgi:glycine cleavage system aminomethyltransferase T